MGNPSLSRSFECLDLSLRIVFPVDSDLFSLVALRRKEDTSKTSSLFLSLDHSVFRSDRLEQSNSTEETKFHCSSHRRRSVSSIRFPSPLLLVRVRSTEKICDKNFQCWSKVMHYYRAPIVRFYYNLVSSSRFFAKENSIVILLGRFSI